MEDKRNTESVVQEIMRLVLTHSGACVNYENHATIKHKENVVVAFSAIESKLRELVERCSVREQSTPMQPIVVDDHGVLRFKKNTIVDNLYEHGVKTGYGLNEMYTESHTDEDRMQFAQLIGYSISGYSTLSYVTDESVNAAFAIANTTKE